MVVDHNSAQELVDGFDVVDSETRAKARRTVAHFATDVDDCALLLQMLGIFPTQERDEVPEVNRPKLPKKGTPKRRNMRPARA